MNKKKGFTLVELLVVIAIIALLMGILMPALARVRQIAYRLYCGTNLSGIGKAMLIYANEYDDEMPRSGIVTATIQGGYGPVTRWDAPNRQAAFGAGGHSNITACFYSLVKYTDVTVKSFMCKGDAGVTAFAPNVAGMDLVDLWDFGTTPQRHCSYSYHIPYGTFPLTAGSEPGMAIAADPNPTQRTAKGNPKLNWQADFLPDGDREDVKVGNAITHQNDGQNVLFMDGHTTFEKSSACGIDEDCIYSRWTPGNPPDKKKGTRVKAGDLPQYKTDSLLLTDGASSAWP